MLDEKYQSRNHAEQREHQDRSDSPANIKTFSDPASTEFIGAGGAPQTLCAITADLAVVTSTDTLTIEEAQFMIERVG